MKELMLKFVEKRISDLYHHRSGNLNAVQMEIIETLINEYEELQVFLMKA